MNPMLAWLPALVWLNCGLSESVAQGTTEGVRSFAFGTPTSVTRAGFTKVTVKDVFTVERGYGFQSAQGLEAFERGGSRIERPKDEYTASVYGAYRTTSDITCALVEGRSDNAFLVTMPDGTGSTGEYRVVPEMIEPPAADACRVEAGQLKQWWLTVHVPPDTPAGRYRMSLTVRPQQALPTTLEWRLLVLPFPLARPADKRWAALPGNNKTANRYQFAENVLDFVHEVPGCQTAITVTADCVRRLGDHRVDVRIYAYGYYNRDKVVQEAKQGHPFWYYENGMFYAHSTLASRGLAGFQFLRSGAEAATAWGFSATNANPYNDFDGGHKDWNVIFPGVDGPTPTIYWELCREGVDDCRYVATLQQQILQAKEQGQTEAAQRAERVLKPLLATEGRLSSDLESMDIHTWCTIPESELAKKCFFYIDDVSLEVIEEPPLAISTPLDVYYVGEPIPWSASTAAASGPIKIALLAGERLVAEQTGQAGSGPLCGTFVGHGLQPGVYTLQANSSAPQQAPQAARRQVMVAPDPFDWQPPTQRKLE